MRLPGLLALCLFICGAASAQDLRRVQSPNQHWEFRVFLALEEERNFFRVAYQVDHSGKPVIGTSFLGLDIWDQEPLLGENTGLTSSDGGSGPNFNWLTVRYMQNGSIGRPLVLEIRAYDTGVAFRYTIPVGSTMLRQVLITEEATEFAVVKDAPKLHIGEVRAPGYPAMHLSHEEDGTLVTRLARLPKNPILAFEGNSPLTTSWRVISLDGAAAPPVEAVGEKSR